jgi:Na+-driven multidrug efflux pump
MLGPAEVVAWGILGNIWNGAHELIDSMADASEVRVAFLMGSGDPARARVSAYKSMVIGTFTALYITCLVYMAGDSLPTWFTNDPTLQHILKGILPIFGLASLVMAMDTISWTIVGAQGRYRLATVIVCVISWTVTIPLAVLFSVVWNVDLNGQMTAFALGYLAMGVAHSYLLFRSNWYELSEEVMEEHHEDFGSTEVPGMTRTNEMPSSTIHSKEQPTAPSTLWEDDL